jgi:hypothetical protein
MYAKMVIGLLRDLKKIDTSTIYKYIEKELEKQRLIKELQTIIQAQIREGEYILHIESREDSIIVNTIPLSNIHTAVSVPSPALVMYYSLEYALLECGAPKSLIPLLLQKTLLSTLAFIDRSILTAPAEHVVFDDTERSVLFLKEESIDSGDAFDEALTNADTVINGII